MSDEQRNTEPDRVVVRDRRRIDPLTGSVREPEAARSAAGPEAGSGPGAGAGLDAPGPVRDPAEEKLAELSAQLDERTADLQRVTAEYANYRRRVDRDREAITVAARAQVAQELLVVLDDLDRAEQHGDLTGPFKAVGDKLVGTLSKLGLSGFGADGDPFDPAVHEAVQHSTSAEVDGPTVTMVLRKGYRMGDRLLRPALVAVTDRDPGAEPVQPAEPAQSSELAEQPAGEAEGSRQESTE